MTQWGLDTLFNPAKRHMDEEKRRLQSTREEVGDNSGGKRIDLESGKVVISRADDAAADDMPKDAGARRKDAGAKPDAGAKRKDAGAKHPGAKHPGAKHPRTEDAKLSPAAERAAKRRARKTT